MSGKMDDFQFPVSQINHITFENRNDPALPALDVVIEGSLGRMHVELLEAEVAADVVPVRMGVQKRIWQGCVLRYKTADIQSCHSGVDYKSLLGTCKKEDPDSLVFQYPCILKQLLHSAPSIKARTRPLKSSASS